MAREIELGQSGLSTPPLILGGNVFGWTADKNDSFAVLDAFAAGGGKMVDTANSYSSWVPGNEGGESETIIGEWLSQRGGRSEILIATKVGSPLKSVSGGLSPESIKTGVEDSLRRLRTDYIDLYYAHYDDSEANLDATMGAFDSLVREGKVRAIAASNYSAERLRQALETSSTNGFASYSVLQPEYNLMARSGFESELQSLCVEKNIGVAPYFALASGFLTGKYRSESDLGLSARGGSVKQYFTPRGMAVLSSLDSIANELGATQSQIALAWLAAQPSVVAPIASATSVKQLEELLGVLNISLTPDHISALNKSSE